MPWTLDEVGSTQRFMKDRLSEGEELLHLDYVFAEKQTEGMGRQGRSWISDPGNLFISIYLKQYALPVTWIPHWIAVSLIEVLIDLGANPEHLKIKWPNDLVSHRTQKLAGILCEKIKEGVIAGIGVNLISAPHLGERETVNLLKLIPDLNTVKLNHHLRDLLVLKLIKEPRLAELKERYEKHSLLKRGDSLTWEDLNTKKTGQGLFQGYGEYGELKVTDFKNEESSLFSEEIKLKALE